MVRLIFALSLLLHGLCFSQGEASQKLTHEAFIDSVEAISIRIIPAKEELDARKDSIKAETTAPKDEYESTADYGKRLAEFEKGKAARIAVLEQEFQAKTKTDMDKLSLLIAGKEDWQPDWGGSLRKDGSVEAYRERIKQFERKAFEMRLRIPEAEMQLAKADGQEKFKKAWTARNKLYFSRLERAMQLMRDYIVQEQARILSTDKRKPEMSLGAYDADKQEFEIAMSEKDSTQVPFVFSGKFKISTAEAKEMNRETANLTAVIDYVNFPFFDFFPGAKKARVYYKEKELPAVGAFKGIESLEEMPGYMEWKLYADSLISGALAPKNLDSSHAMSAAGLKVPTGIASSGGSSISTRAILRIAAFGLSAASIGLGIMQNGEVDRKGREANRHYAEALAAYSRGELNSYAGKQAAYYGSLNDAKSAENLRTVFYACAGVFGVAGILTFVF